MNLRQRINGKYKIKWDDLFDLTFVKTTEEHHDFYRVHQTNFQIDVVVTKDKDKDGKFIKQYVPVRMMNCKAEDYYEPHATLEDAHAFIIGECHDKLEASHLKPRRPKDETVKKTNK